MKHNNIPYCLIICLLFVLSSLTTSCKFDKKTNTSNQEIQTNSQDIEANTNNQETNKKETETKYQAIWEKALAEKDLTTIDTLIAQNRKFKLTDCDGWLRVFKDTLSNPLECAFYWSLSKIYTLELTYIIPDMA